MPGEVDFRLALLPQRYKGIVVWVGEAKVRLHTLSQKQHSLELLVLLLLVLLVSLFLVLLLLLFCH